MEQNHLKYVVFWMILSVTTALNNRPFPEGFLFGVATASYQIEGAWNQDGKGENIWDRLTHTHPEYIKDGSNGNIACNSYNKLEEDIELIKSLNVNFYRFSLSWSRLLPSGFPNKINPKGVEYYNKLIDKLLENGIEPLITLYHWDLPQPLQDLGGWPNPVLIKLFRSYAKVAFDHFGDRVKYWLTFNEPKHTCQRAYSGDNIRAPALDLSGIGDYLCNHNVLKAHAAVYHLYKDNYKNKYGGKVSIVIETHWFEPKDEALDQEATERKLLFNFGIYAHPIFLGDYPKIVKDRVAFRSTREGFPRSRLPTFTTEEIDYIKGTYDFMALNTYTTFLVEDMEEAPFDRPSNENDIRTKLSQDESWTGSASSWLKVKPEGFYKLLVWLQNTYNNPEIFITENGVSGFGTIEDSFRISYYEEYLSALLDAYYDKGVKIIGYTAWSLLDNFEWENGYTEKFGLFHVDFSDPNRKRTPKKSVEFYRNVTTTRCLVKNCLRSKLVYS